MTRPNLFGADICGAIFDAMGSDMLPATLTRVAEGTRNPAVLTGGQTVGEAETAYSCKGFVDTYTAREIDGTNVRANDRKVILLGGSLPDDVDPRAGDRVTIESGDWKVIRVERDPAGATFTCQARQ